MTNNLFVPPAAEGLPLTAFDSATEGASALDAWATDPRGRNFLAHALVQLARDGWLRAEPGEGFEPYRERDDIPEPQDPAVLSAVPVPPAEQTAPTDWIDGHPQLEAIAAAVWECCEHSDSGLVIDDPRKIAVAAYAAVLAVLPPPAARAAVLPPVRPHTLTAVASHLDARAVAILHPGSETYREWQAVVSWLRGLAAKAPQPERSDVGTEFVRQADHPDEARLAAFETDLAEAQQPDTETRGCPDPIECGHEAALGEARETNQRLNLRTQRLESELAAYQRAVRQWVVDERGTYVPLRTIAAIAKAAGRDIEHPRWLMHYQRVEQAEAVTARVREWVTSDVVTARSEFGNGYREAQRDIRDLLDGGKTGQPAAGAGQDGAQNRG